jgi:hypothetical protein
MAVDERSSCTHARRMQKGGQKGRRVIAHRLVIS